MSTTTEIANALLTDPPSPPVPPGRSFGDVLAEVSGKVQTGTPIIETLPAGWGLVDETVGGLPRGEFVGLIGNPGTGKTTLADQLVAECLRLNPQARALIFALETAPAVRVARLVANACVSLTEAGAVHGVPVSAMLRGQLRDAGRERAQAAIAGLTAEPGNRLRFVDDLQAAGDIANAIEHERPDVVLIDHLGLVVSDVAADSETSRFDSALGRIAIALRRAGCAGILINETSKAALTADRIDLAASRGSARFASLAAVFIGLQRTPPKPPDTEPRVLAALVKNRFGATDRYQRARFFGGLAYFDWQAVEQVQEQVNGDGR